MDQSEVNEKYRQFKELVKGGYDLLKKPPEVGRLIEELIHVDKGMLETASSTYMQSIGRPHEIDYDIAMIDGTI